MFISFAETQSMFIESIMNSFSLTYDSWYTDFKVANDGLEFQVDVGSAQNIINPIYLMAAHQSFAKIRVSNKAQNLAVSYNIDDTDVRRYFLEIDGQRYPKDSIIINFSENGCLDQYRDRNFFHREYVGKEVMKPFIKYTDMRTFSLHK